MIDDLEAVLGELVGDFSTGEDFETLEGIFDEGSHEAGLATAYWADQ